MERDFRNPEDRHEQRETRRREARYFHPKNERRITERKMHRSEKSDRPKYRTDRYSLGEED